MLPKTLLGFLCGLLVPGVLEPLCRHLQGTPGTHLGRGPTCWQCNQGTSS